MSYDSDFMFGDRASRTPEDFIDTHTDGMLMRGMPSDFSISVEEQLSRRYIALTFALNQPPLNSFKGLYKPLGFVIMNASDEFLLNRAAVLTGFRVFSLKKSSTTLTLWSAESRDHQPFWDKVRELKESKCSVKSQLLSG